MILHIFLAFYLRFLAFFHPPVFQIDVLQNRNPLLEFATRGTHRSSHTQVLWFLCYVISLSLSRYSIENLFRSLLNC